MISHFKFYKGSEDELFSKTVSEMVNFKNKTRRIFFKYKKINYQQSIQGIKNL
jgi:hypothetical protein